MKKILLTGVSGLAMLFAASAANAQTTVTNTASPGANTAASEGDGNGRGQWNAANVVSSPSAQTQSAIGGGSDNAVANLGSTAIEMVDPIGGVIGAHNTNQTNYTVQDATTNVGGVTLTGGDAYGGNANANGGTGGTGNGGSAAAAQTATTSTVASTGSASAANTGSATGRDATVANVAASGSNHLLSAAANLAKVSSGYGVGGNANGGSSIGGNGGNASVALTSGNIGGIGYGTFSGIATVAQNTGIGATQLTSFSINARSN